MSLNLVRGFTVDLTLVGMAAIYATGRQFYGSQEVAAAMPRATIPNGKLTFFQTDRLYTPAAELWSEVERRRTVLANPHILAGFVSANREFVDTHPVATQWLDADSNVCCVSFGRFNEHRTVGVYQNDDGWHGRWWFPCVDK